MDELNRCVKLQAAALWRNSLRADHFRAGSKRQIIFENKLNLDCYCLITSVTLHPAARVIVFAALINAITVEAVVQGRREPWLVSSVLPVVEM
jgi:hypothetical protein